MGPGAPVHRRFWQCLFALYGAARRNHAQERFRDRGFRLGREVAPDAPQHPVEELPYEVLQFLMSSRYCEVGLLANEAWDLAKAHQSGWARVKALGDASHERIEFDYMKANSERKARSAIRSDERRVGNGGDRKCKI